MAIIVRRDPFAFGNGNITTAFDRFFSDAWRRSSPRRRSTVDEGTLALDVSEQDGEWLVRASLPGFSKDDIVVRVHEGVLSIEATHKSTDESDEQTDEGARYYRRERRSGSAGRRIALPGVLHEAEVDGELKDGVLTLRIPVPEQAKPKQIEIKSA